MLRFKSLGQVPYTQSWQDMKAFTHARDENTDDEIWFLEHPPVYTQGQAGKAEHIMQPKQIPIVQTDRGGQVTYHGPGQLITYYLLDLNRRQSNIKKMVCDIERIMIEVLSNYNIPAHPISGQPGVYVDNEKIASIGLRVRRGMTYHGSALNVDMDLSPFLGINPCGYQKLKMTQMKDHYPNVQMMTVQRQFQEICQTVFQTQFMR